MITTEEIKSGIHKFNVGDIIICTLKNKKFTGVVCKKGFSLLHNHPYIKAKGVSFATSYESDMFMTTANRFYSADGIYKLGVLK